ncbi:glucosylceramidase-like [Anoplophora glabripennis]|uniref:glucosylceramidase-like n=1 Tax=Anoplophora glabripennis TaxID=217634 RepID=UPI000875149B|nr:glucosylceramidase-like [Anoplophora glabripennis]
MSIPLLGLLLSLLGLGTISAEDCLARDYGNNGTVCVCNADQCDTIARVQTLSEGSYLLYTSNMAGLRFQIDNGTFSELSTTSENRIIIDQDDSYQEILGWGGAFTDATGININSLSSGAKEKLMRSYFSEDGLEYSLCRVPIGGTDFSTHGYTYVDETEPDVELTTFALTDEDYQLKIPLIREAFNLTDNNLRLFASAWTAPKWMKLNGAYSGLLGFLKSAMYQPWANYFLKFLEAYDSENIPFWGITTGNEPSLGFFPIEIPSVAWTFTQMRIWIRTNLGPTLRNSPYSNITIMALDDQRIFLPWYIDGLFLNSDVRNYIDGIATHWYWDDIIPPSMLTTTHDTYPEKFLLATEACVGDGDDISVVLGSWSRGEQYVFSIIEYVNHWTTGWLDWNMALDETGGPTYINNNVDSPIIVNASADEFYKQPMYYGIGHFSKFVPRGSVKISCSQFASDVPTTAFKRPDGGVVVVILNQRDEEVPVVIADATRGEVNLNLSARSFTSVLYW